MGAEAENAMTSYERLQYYRDNLKPEASPDSITITPPTNWPTTGSIVLENVCIRPTSLQSIVILNAKL